MESEHDTDEHHQPPATAAPTLASIDDDAVLTYGEVALLLRVGVSTVRRLVRTGELVAVAVGSGSGRPRVLGREFRQYWERTVSQGRRAAAARRRVTRQRRQS